MNDKSDQLQNKPNYSLSNLQETSILLSRGLHDINKIKQANEHFSKGKKAYDAEDYETAISEYSQAIELDPKNSLYFFERGNVYSVIIQDNNAISDYTNAININPNNIEYYKGIAEAYVGERCFDKAIEYYTKAIEIDKTNTDLYFDRAIIYETFFEENIEKAFSDYEMIIKIDPNEAVGYFGRGNLHYKNKKYEEAIKDFNNGLRINPDYAVAYERRGNCYYFIGEYEKALVDYKKAIGYDTYKKYPNSGMTKHIVRKINRLYDIINSK
jgi:tetratricopeptide (TPR) repeat protein